MLVSEKIAKFVQDCDSTKLPDGLLDQLKILLVDAFGVLIAGSTAIGAEPVADLVGHWGGAPEATALVYGGKVPAPSAALLNGIMLHARELDDDHEEASIHAFAAVLPAALAMAEKEGTGGKEFLSALIAGSEISCRLGMSIKILRGWHFSAVCGTFGAAAAAGKLMGLDSEGIVNALGLAFTRAAGNLQPGREGAMAKRLQPAFAAQAGVLSAELARAGITGPKQVFEGQYNFFRLYDSDYYAPGELRHRLDGAEYDRGALVNGLGETFEVGKLIIKPYGSCRFTHGPLEAALNLAQKHDLSVERIERIEVLACPRAVRDYGKPYDALAVKTPEIAAQFSIPYVVSAAIVHRSGYIDAFEREAVLDPRIMEVASKITVSVHPEAALKVPVEVRIATKDGTVFVERIDALKASLQRPMTQDEILEKYWRNARYAKKTIAPNKLKQLIELVLNIEEVKNINELTELLS
ncbi:MmgE/PrpD family protein [Paradesulfitobacterium ferrireducens]|uniref:MmgE/PrpD family protein n=1 Tax=Paradesulfitobacterium ferrireducens TaxID=2816476 RepID=UPI001A8F31DE|nr:MmgE/PrpD family protein [Paradesulfitobacterium ferrireducens]